MDRDLSSEQHYLPFEQQEPDFWSRSGTEKTYTAHAYVQASAAKWTQYFPISSCIRSLMSWIEYHKYPEGMTPLNLYKLKNLHVSLTGLAKKREFLEESHLIIIWEELK